MPLVLACFLNVEKAKARRRAKATVTFDGKRLQREIVLVAADQHRHAHAIYAKEPAENVMQSRCC